MEHGWWYGFVLFIRLSRVLLGMDAAVSGDKFIEGSDRDFHESNGTRCDVFIRKDRYS